MSIMMSIASTIIALRSASITPKSSKSGASPPGPTPAM